MHIFSPQVLFFGFPRKKNLNEFLLETIVFCLAHFSLWRVLKINKINRHNFSETSNNESLAYVAKLAQSHKKYSTLNLTFVFLIPMKAEISAQFFFVANHSGVGHRGWQNTLWIKKNTILRNYMFMIFCIRRYLHSNKNKWQMSLENG